MCPDSESTNHQRAHVVSLPRVCCKSERPNGVHIGRELTPMLSGPMLPASACLYHSSRPCVRHAQGLGSLILLVPGARWSLRCLPSDTQTHTHTYTQTHTHTRTHTHTHTCMKPTSIVPGRKTHRRTTSQPTLYELAPVRTRTTCTKSTFFHTRSPNFEWEVSLITQQASHTRSPPPFLPQNACHNPSSGGSLSEREGGFHLSDKDTARTE